MTPGKYGWRYCGAMGLNSRIFPTHADEEIGQQGSHWGTYVEAINLGITRTTSR